MPEPVRVCMVVTDFDAPVGGVQKQARALIAHLRRRGHQVSVLTRNYHGCMRREMRDGVAIRRWPVYGRGRALNSLIFLLGAAVWLLKNRNSYDIIHGHQAYAPATIGALAGRILGKPVLIKVTCSSERGEAQEIRSLPLSSVRRRLFSWIDRFVALTPEIAHELLSLGVREDQIVAIPNGVDLPPRPAYEPGTRAAARGRLRLPSGPIVVYAGRLSAEKRLDTLLRAWAHVLEGDRESHLVLLGEGTPHGNVEPHLRALAKDLRIDDRVHLMGRVGNVPDYLLAADVFVLGSTSEGMSNALLEAMAAGLAIAASDIEANRASVEHDREALLFLPESAEANAEALARLLAAPALRERLGRAARERAEADCSMERVVDRYIDLYDGLVRERILR